MHERHRPSPSSPSRPRRGRSSAAASRRPRSPSRAGRGRPPGSRSRPRSRPLTKRLSLSTRRDVELHDVDAHVLDRRVRPLEQPDVVGLLAVLADRRGAQELAAGVLGHRDRHLVGTGGRPGLELLVVEEELDLLGDAAGDRLDDDLDADDLPAAGSGCGRILTARRALPWLIAQASSSMSRPEASYPTARTVCRRGTSPRSISTVYGGRVRAQDELVLEVELDLRDRRLDVGLEAQEADRRLAGRRDDLQLRAAAVDDVVESASSAITIASAEGSVDASPGAMSGEKTLPTSGTETSVEASPTCLPPGAARTSLSL